MLITSAGKYIKAHRLLKVKHDGSPESSFLRAERTPEAVAVSGIYGRGGDVAPPAHFPAGIPEPNLRGAGGAAPAGYLERIANVPAWLGASCAKHRWFIAGNCTGDHGRGAGHSFAKEIVCGKEWCEVCSQEGSTAHNRKLARWLKKAQQMESIGYFVFTIPLELRDNFRSKKSLAEFGRKVQEKMKVHGYGRGLRRWHFFGDKSSRYNPHLNVLVDAGYIPPEKLETIKQVYATLLGIDVADVNYHYRTAPGQKYHTLKYITRATFLDWSWDEEFALEVRGFRNAVAWGRGKWDGEPAWTLDDLAGSGQAEVAELNLEAIEALAEKKCPVCGEPVVWKGVYPLCMLDIGEKESYGAGYWRLADERAPPELSPETKTRLYWLRLIKINELRQAQKLAAAEALRNSVPYQPTFHGLSQTDTPPNLGS